MKMKSVYIVDFKMVCFFFIFGMFYSCDKQEYFEGVITYDIEYIVYDSSIDVDNLKASYGIKSELY